MFTIQSYLTETTKTVHTKHLSNLGVVLAIGDGIARVAGLPQIKAGEMVYIFGAKKKVRGLALNLETEQIGVVLFGNDRYIRQGDLVLRTQQIVNVAVGPTLLSRVVDALEFGLMYVS